MSTAAHYKGVEWSFIKFFATVAITAGAGGPSTRGSAFPAAG